MHAYRFRFTWRSCHQIIKASRRKEKKKKLKHKTIRIIRFVGQRKKKSGIHEMSLRIVIYKSRGKKWQDKNEIIFFSFAKGNTTVSNEGIAKGSRFVVVILWLNSVFQCRIIAKGKFASGFGETQLSKESPHKPSQAKAFFGDYAILQSVSMPNRHCL